MSDQNNALDRIFGEAGSDGAYVWPAGAFDGIIVARVLAFFADIALILVLSGIALIAYLILTAISFGLLWPIISLAPLLPLAYFTLTLGGPHSATPGMRWQGIELRTWDGYRPGYLQAAIQTILFYVFCGFVIVLLVPLFNYRRRCLHDYLCGTVFVRSPGLVSL
tara:strand:- start:3218 stop:3712 length:495 start_codon:yes stop_codon:yes gene_type:complete